MVNEFRFALRQLAKRPGFTAVVVLTVAVGIGATTAIFSVVNALLLRPIPVADPERLVNIEERTEQGRFKTSFSLPEYLEYRERAVGVADVAAHHLSDIMLNTGEETAATLALDVSGNYFDVLDIEAARGRFFTEDEASGPDAASVAVISHALWRNALGADPAVVGRTIIVNSQPLTVIGVAPAGFQGTMVGARPAAWLPAALYERVHHAGDPYRWGQMTLFQLFARLAPEMQRPQAEARLTAIARHLAQDHWYWGEAPVGVRLREFSAVPPAMRDAAREFVSLLLIAAGLVLAIAAVNVAGMLLARGADRGREMAIRLALGARRRRLVSQLLVESVTLAMLGGAGGLVLASWLADLLATTRPPGAGSFSLDLGLDARVLVFAVGVSVVTGVAFGLVPAIAATRRNVNETLKNTATGPRRLRLRSAMVAGQLALSLVLLATAGLFVRTLQSALTTQHGFDPENVLAVELNLRLNDYDEPRGRAFYAHLLERVRALPGAESAALAEVVPLGFTWQQRGARIPGFEPPPGQPAGFSVGYNVVSPGYFRTLRMPLIEGRLFDQSDRPGRSRVMIINETFARRFWPNESPVGRRIEFSSEHAEIIGVVPAGRYRAFDEEPTLFAFVPFEQEYRENMWLHVRARRELRGLVAAIRQEIRALDPNVAPISVTTVEDILGSSLFPQRLAAGLVGGFGLMGLLLAAVGVFGLLSFTVAQRTREIGLRMALGAKQADVLRLVLRRGLVLVVIGTGAGLAVAVLATRLVRGLLVNVSPTDPVTLVAVVGLLTFVALIAAWLPARRAARVHPMEALRYE
jgi:predicted permease